MSAVLDASTTMAWCFDDESTAQVEAVFDRIQAMGAVVPALWPVEIANSLLVAERRQRLTRTRVARFVQTLAALPIRVDPVEVATVWGAVLDVGREYGLSAYDASYLELAIREGLPLAALDARLLDAARRAGVRCI